MDVVVQASLNKVELHLSERFASLGIYPARQLVTQTLHCDAERLQRHHLQKAGVSNAALH